MNARFRPGDALLNFCSAIYVSRIAWERGHWIAVVAMWVASTALNGLWDYYDKREVNATKAFLASLKRGIEKKAGRI